MICLPSGWRRAQGTIYIGHEILRNANCSACGNCHNGWVQPVFVWLHSDGWAWCTELYQNPIKDRRFSLPLRRLFGPQMVTLTWEVLNMSQQNHPEGANSQLGTAELNPLSWLPRIYVADESKLCPILATPSIGLPRAEATIEMLWKSICLFSAWRTAQSTICIEHEILRNANCAAGNRHNGWVQSMFVPQSGS